MNQENTNLEKAPAIEIGVHVELAYTMKLPDGTVVEKSDDGEPIGFLFGHGQMIAGVEQAIEGLKPGDTKSFEVHPRDGYGEVREDLIQQVPLSNFPPDSKVEPGKVFESIGPHGVVPLHIVKVDGDQVTVDLNHPLAGKTLLFDVKIVSTRPSSDAEIAALYSSSCSTGSCAGCAGGCGI